MPYLFSLIFPLGSRRSFIDTTVTDGDVVVTAIVKFKAPNLKLVLAPEQIRIAQAGDIAIDVGEVQADMDAPPSGHVMPTAKDVVVWTRMNGAWKAEYDIFNANGPPPPSTTPK